MRLSELILGEDVVTIAQRLLGATITTTINGEITSGKIVETEAYKAPEDKGSHAYNNRRTRRTETLFAQGGTIYIYLCYGIHHLFNVVTGPKDVAHAVLVRAIEPIFGQDIMLQRRGIKKEQPQLTNGPGKLTQALGITTQYNGLVLHQSADPIIHLALKMPISVEHIIASPRVGIGYAAECAHWPWRFRIANNNWTSLPDKVIYPDP